MLRRAAIRPTAPSIRREGGRERERVLDGGGTLTRREGHSTETDLTSGSFKCPIPTYSVKNTLKSEFNLVKCQIIQVHHFNDLVFFFVFCFLFVFCQNSKLYSVLNRRRITKRTSCRRETSRTRVQCS